jgi:hypothetical protein
MSAGPAISTLVARGIQDTRSLEKRSRIEQFFNRVKNIGLLGKTLHRGRGRLQWTVQFSLAAYTLAFPARPLQPCQPAQPGPRNPCFSKTLK